MEQEVNLFLFYVLIAKSPRGTQQTTAEIKQLSSSCILQLCVVKTANCGRSLHT